MNKNADLTVCIPAYNNNESLERALNSVKDQTIANQIDIFISDDCSPIPIDKERLEKFKKYFHSFKIIRQNVNLGVLSNAEWLFKNIKTDFYTFLQHDDVIADINFYKRAVEYFQKNKKLVCYFGNSVLSSQNVKNRSDYDDVINSSLSMYSIFDTELQGLKDDYSIAGEDLILNLTNQKLKFNTSWSAVIFNREASLMVGGFGGGYTLSIGEASILNIYREEEHFALLYLLCCIGQCQLEKKPSVIRIIEPSSFSRSPTHPAILMSQDSAFFAMYKLASVIERSFKTKSSEKIIELILIQISNIALKSETAQTKKFFSAYKLKNKRYWKLVKNSLDKSRKLKSKFEFIYLLKAYFRYYKNLFLEKIFQDKETYYFYANFKLISFIKDLMKIFLKKLNNIFKKLKRIF